MVAVTVFTGPSLAPSRVRTLLPDADVRPPVARGDLHAARKGGADLILVIDGSFSQRLAVSPREVIDVLGDGAVVLGASSMGAIRAAECWPAGMRGVGAVFRMYRQGLLSSDDAVAVATDPDRDHMAVSVALVNVHAAVRRAYGRGLIDKVSAEAVERTAAELFFARRTWRAILHQARIADSDGRLQSFLESVDVKRDDALRAIRQVTRLGNITVAPSTTDFSRPPRYPGHDPLLGVPTEEAEDALLRWLFGSGRHQRYVWPLVVGEPEFDDLGSAPDRSAALRERLAAVLARLLDEPEELARRLREELVFLEEFETELMHWHAISRLAEESRALCASPPKQVVTAVRESVAIAHGYGDWHSLAGDVQDGRLYGAIPLPWVEDACAQLAWVKLRHERESPR